MNRGGYGWVVILWTASSVISRFESSVSGADGRWLPQRGEELNSVQFRIIPAALAGKSAIFFRLFANQPMPKAPSFGVVPDLSLGME